jgi:hypothetical protein
MDNPASRTTGRSRLWVILHAPLPDSSDNPQVPRVIDAMQAMEEFLHIDR